jgi:hypothetical protein
LRKLKYMGAMALAVTALSAAFAASASAEGFESSVYPEKITGTQEGIATLTSTKGTMECKTSLSGGEIIAAGGAVTMSMSGYCEAFGTKNSFNMGTCKVELTPEWNAAAFGPSGCGPITINGGFCTLTIPAQRGLYTTYEDTGSGVRVSLQTNYLRYSGCGAADNEEGSFKVTWKLTGSPGLLGFSPASHGGLFTAEKYPATLKGSQTEGYDEFLTEGGKVECPGGVSYSGTLAASSSTISLSPTFTECHAFGFFNSTVAANGCQFTYHNTGTFDVGCPTGSSITITASTCAVSIPAQSGLKSVSYQTVAPSPSGRGKVKITHSIGNLTYTVTKDGIGCPFSGTGTRTSGSFTGKALIEGLNSEGRPLNID